jgi:hypothetical protein
MKTPRPNDRIVDNTTEFTSKIQTYERHNSPRQIRLRREKQATIAQHHLIIEAIFGIIALVALILILAFI